MGLALDVGLGGLALVVEGVELLLQPVLGRDPGVDGAAQAWRLHGERSVLPSRSPRSRRPKKRGPFQLRARDGAGHLREAVVGLPVPGKALLQHHHAMEHPVPFAHEQRAGLDGLACSGADLSEPVFASRSRERTLAGSKSPCTSAWSR